MIYIFPARLEDAGISVWVDSTGLRSGVDFLSKIGQAIIDAKLFVSLVSEKSLKSKFCRDELSLAYISDKFLFPVALDSLSNLVGVMDTGKAEIMKTSLACRANLNSARPVLLFMLCHLHACTHSLTIYNQCSISSAV